MSERFPGGTCVYSITNKTNGMKYIGVTAHAKNRFRDHCRATLKTKSYIRSALLHYGKENFDFDVLVVADRQYCLELEAKMIVAYNTLTPNGYNICGGGEGPVATLSGESHPWFGKKFTQEHRDKIAASNRGQKRSQEFCEKLSAINVGKTLSEEHKQKISKSLTGKKLTPEHCESMRKAVLGRVVSEETRRKMSESAKANALAKRLMENSNEH
jgi:group I intron endonuclease